MASLLLFPTFCKVKLYDLVEERKVKKAFYHNEAFKQADLRLKGAYCDVSAYALSKHFLEQKGESNIHMYGETPLTTLYKMTCQFLITPQDVIVELGSGRGRSLNFWYHYLGCKVLGIEWHPVFVERFPSTDLCRMLLADFLEVDLSKASVIYFYGTNFKEEVIRVLCSRLSKVAPTVKIITVSYPLSDYSSHFKTEKMIEGSFPWGKADIFLNRRFF